MKKRTKQINKNKTPIRFEFAEPSAQKVGIAGSFNDWQCEPMSKSLNDRSRWIKELSLLPGQHEYLFIVDGEWRPDPNAKEAVPNPFGHVNSLLTVG